MTPTNVRNSASDGVALSIVIVNWNSRQYLANCLASIRRYVPPLDYEVVVVDSGSFDGCAEMLRGEAAVVFVQSETNIGFARANNLAVEHARGDMLLFLNPDTELQAGAVGELLAAHRALHQPGVVGACLRNSDGTLQRSCVMPFPTLLNQALDADRLQRRFPHIAVCQSAQTFEGAVSPVEVQAVSGACMMLSRARFDALGGFSADYFMYAEDLDLCWASAAAGCVNAYVPRAQVVHHGGGSSRHHRDSFANVLMRESLNRLLRKRHGPAYARLHRCVIGLVALLRLGLLAAVRRHASPSATKWTTLLRWSLGREPWAADPMSISIPRAGTGSTPPGEGATQAASFVLLTAAKDESEYIGKTIASVIAQTVHPSLWVIVDDGSTDTTAEIVRQAAQQHGFIRLMSRTGTGERSFGAKDLAINAAYHSLRSEERDGASAPAFNFVAIQDADIAPQNTGFFARLLDTFAADEALGVAGGYIHEREHGVWKSRRSNSIDSVAGGLQMFRRRCFEQIGGYTPLHHGGEDWLVQLDARKHGWTVRVLIDEPVFHYRVTSSASGRVRGLFRLGLMDASFGSHPAFELLKCARRLGTRPLLAGASLRYFGYCWWHLTRRPPVIDSETVAFLRRSQLDKAGQWWRATLGRQ